MKVKVTFSILIRRLTEAEGDLHMAAVAYGYGRRSYSKGWTDEKYVTSQHKVHKASERYARAFAALRKWKLRTTEERRRDG